MNNALEWWLWGHCVFPTNPRTISMMIKGLCRYEYTCWWEYKERGVFFFEIKEVRCCSENVYCKISIWWPSSWKYLNFHQIGFTILLTQNLGINRSACHCCYCILRAYDLIFSIKILIWNILVLSLPFTNKMKRILIYSPILFSLLTSIRKWCWVCALTDVLIGHLCY